MYVTTLLNIWKNLERFSLQSLSCLKLYSSQFFFLRSALKALILNFLKFLYSMQSGKGVIVESYTVVNTGKWSEMSAAMRPLMQAEAKFEWTWSMQVWDVSVIRVASKILGWNPLDLMCIDINIFHYQASPLRQINFTQDFFQIMFINNSYYQVSRFYPNIFNIR